MKWMTTYEINLHKPDSQEYISPLIHTGKRLTSTTYIENASTSKPLEIKTAEVVELVDTTDSKHSKYITPIPYFKGFSA